MSRHYAVGLVTALTVTLAITSHAHAEVSAVERQLAYIESRVERPTAERVHEVTTLFDGLQRLAKELDVAAAEPSERDAMNRMRRRVMAAAARAATIDGPVTYHQNVASAVSLPQEGEAAALRRAQEVARKEGRTLGAEDTFEVVYAPRTAVGAALAVADALPGPLDDMSAREVLALMRRVDPEDGPLAVRVVELVAAGKAPRDEAEAMIADWLRGERVHERVMVTVARALPDSKGLQLLVARRAYRHGAASVHERAALEMAGVADARGWWRGR